MKIIKRAILITAVILTIYFIGPSPSTPAYNKTFPEIPELLKLEEYVKNKEAIHHLKKNNEARIIWANDSNVQKTNYSLVYLHGFSASQEEGNPVHRNIAKRFGFNLYLSRLSQHGIDTTDQLINLTADNYWESAKEALAIGKKIGNKVILMGTSTGCAQALQLAAAYPDDIAALILYSPNIAIKDSKAFLLNNPWGLQISRLVIGSNYFDPKDNRPIYSAYWNKPYRLEALVNLQEMIETSMNKETFKKIKMPVLMLYYYKDEEHQDQVVDLGAMNKMFEQLSTPDSLKRSKAMPSTGDHVMASPIKSQDVESVEKETSNFLVQKLWLK